MKEKEYSFVEIWHTSADGAERCEWGMMYPDELEDFEEQLNTTEEVDMIRANMVVFGIDKTITIPKSLFVKLVTREN